MLEREIQQILDSRDSAILSKSREAFLSTQLSEISDSSTTGYLSLDRLSSLLIAAHQDEEDPKLAVGLVKESYWHQGSYTHCGYLLYYFRRDQSGVLKVVGIAWKARGIVAPTELDQS